LRIGPIARADVRVPAVRASHGPAPRGPFIFFDNLVTTPQEQA